MGSFVSSDEVRKVLELSDTLLGTMAGGAADCQFWEKYLSMQCRLYELKNGEKPSTAAASRMFVNIVYYYRRYGLSIGAMLAGVDKSGVNLWYIDDDGTRLKGNMFSVGSGSTYAYGVLDSYWRYDLTLQEAVDLGTFSSINFFFFENFLIYQIFGFSLCCFYVK